MVLSAYDVIDAAIHSTNFKQFKDKCAVLIARDLKQDELDEDAYNDAMRFGGQ